MQILNKAQVQQLFEKESVFLGKADQVPVHRAIALFGKNAVDFAYRQNEPNRPMYTNGYGIGDFTVGTLTFLGFQAAASFHNARLLQQEEAEWKRTGKADAAGTQDGCIKVGQKCSENIAK